MNRPFASMRLLSIVFLIGYAGVSCGQDLAPASSPITNADFESGTDAWSIHVYGAKPKIDADATIKHQGKQSLRISAEELSDSALGQEFLLKAGHWYRFQGWVRTRDLTTNTATVLGTFQIQMPGGNGVIASGANHQGTTDWSPVTIDFEAPAGGLTRVAVFLTGYGTGTGTAWFDDLSLQEIDPARVPLRMTRTPLPGKIHPFQYGQFVEYLCDLIPSMWAEKLCDGSFEGLTPYKVAFIRQTDFRERPWYPYGAVNRADYSLDRDQHVSGETSQRVQANAGASGRVGVVQDGIAVDHQIPCDFSVFLRQTGIEGPVTIRLLQEEQELAAVTFEPTADWAKYRSRLVPNKSAANVRLSITFSGPGTLWIDNASLMPIDNVGGWRADVVAATRLLKPGIIRFGGSALDDVTLGEFEWRDTIGNVDRRRPFRAWGGLQPTGPGLEEIVQFCRLVDAEPLICVRFSQRKPQDAAEQVEYFNGSIETPLGQLRAKNGHPEPYHVKYWQVGNERAGTEYENQLADICNAMLAVDPSITLLSSYPTEGVLRQAGNLIQYVCPHHYDCANLAGCERDLQATTRMLEKHSLTGRVKLAITEWNTTAGDWGTGRAKLWTLENALACARYHNLMHRHADLVEISNRSNLINSFCSGIIQTDNHRLYKTPAFYAQQLYATHAGTRPLKIESTLAVHAAPDVSATLSEDGKVVALFAINSQANEISRPIDLSDFGKRGQEIAVWTLADRLQANEVDVTNNFADPERISLVESKFVAVSPQFHYKFPGYSLTLLLWHVD